jgi:hypothetical protein
MKNRIIGLLTIALFLALTGCSEVGRTDLAEIDYGNSVTFSHAEIETAVGAVLVKFKDFQGCNLLRLWYDEDRSNTSVQSYLASGGGSVNGVEAENIIILYSDFYVDSSGGDGSFNPDYTYHDWNWILIRADRASDWVVDDWGY